MAALPAALFLPAAAGHASSHDDLARDVPALFRDLPGRTSLLIWAPATAAAPALTIAYAAQRRMFIGSAFKAFALCERLRQLDGVDVVRKLQTNLLPLDASVWVPDSTMFAPPNLSGKVPERTAAEAMIMHSDNTGTDIVMAATGPDTVRQFIAQLGLKTTQIPDSTRSFYGYLLGLPNFRQTTWAQVVAADAANAPIVNPPLNNVETMASSCADLVTFYARTLGGEFFQHPETLQEFRRILSTADAIPRIVPLGASAFAKGGSIDVPGFHALCVPGAMTFSDRWVYFSIIVNWEAPAETDPTTVASIATATAKALAMVQQALS
jgi:beta-lactamase class A